MMARTKKVLVSIMTAVMMLVVSLFAFTSCDMLKDLPFIGDLIPASATLEKIEVTTNPTKMTYIEGEKFDPAGMVISAIYSDDSKAEVTGWTYSPDGELKKGQTVEVSYTEGEGEEAITKKAKVKITVKNDLVELTVKTPATKTEYMIGETFNPAGMVLEATYENGTKVELAIADITADYKTTALTAEDTEITITYAGKTVTQAITFAKGVFIEAEDGTIVSSTVDINSDSEEASGGLYVGDMKAEDTITFSFVSDKAGMGDIEFRLASLYLKEDSNWTPIWMGDCQFNKICEFSVNGVKYDIADSVVLPGGGEPGGEPDASLWFNWKQVKFENINFVEGRNDILLKFIPHDYTDTSQSGFSGTFTANIDSLIVTSAACEISPCEFALEYIATGVKLEKATVEEKEVVYFVVEGTTTWVGWNDEEVAAMLDNSIAFDFQGDLFSGSGTRTLNTADAWEVEVTKTANGEGTFKMMVDVATLVGKYSTHFGDWVTEGAEGSMQNFDYLATSAVATGETITAGAKTYTLFYDPTYSTRNENVAADDSNARRENCYGCVGIIATSSQKLEYAYTNATLAEENGKAIYNLNGTYTAEGYTEAELKEAFASIYMDMQGNPYAWAGSWDGDWEYYRPTCIDVVIDAENGTYQAKYDITEMKDFCYTSHYGSSSTDFKPADAYEAKITIGSKIYEMLVVPGSSDGAKYWGCVGVKISTKQDKFIEFSNREAVELVVENDKVYAVLKGTYEGYTEEEILAAAAVDFEPGDGSTGSAMVATNENYTLTTDNGSFVLKVDITNMEAGYYWSHAFKGFGSSNGDMENAAGCSVVCGNKTYSYKTQTYSWGSRINLVIEVAA